LQGVIYLFAKNWLKGKHRKGHFLMLTACNPAPDTLRQESGATLRPQVAPTNQRTARQIKAQPFCWQAVSALQTIRAVFQNHRRMAALVLYTTLTEIASQQRTPGQGKTSCAYLANLAGLSEPTARRYLHEFEQIGLLRIIPGVHAANTYVLLGDPLADGLSSPLKLADAPTSHASQPTTSSRLQPVESAGQRHGSTSVATVTQHGITADRPEPPRGITADRPEPPRGITADRQVITRVLNKKDEQPTNRLVGEQQVDVAIAEQPAADYARAGEAINGLVRLGVRRSLAEQLAGCHPPAQVEGWVLYAQATVGLTNRAGFVLARLRAGDQPPSPAPTIGDWLRQRQAAAAEQSTLRSNPAPQASPPTLAPPTASATTDESQLEQAKRVWLAAQPDLELLVGGDAWQGWLTHCRLIAVAGDCWQVWQVPGGLGRVLAERWGAQIATLLSHIAGGRLRLQFGR